MAKTQKVKASPPVQSTIEPIPASKLGRFAPIAFLFLLAVLLYANTFSHSYALDDAIVITDNQFTQEGAAGIGDLMTNDAFTGFFGEKKDLVAGGRYRPLSMVTFALEISVFGNNNPGISHVINALLYGIIAILLYQILMQLFQPEDKQKWWLSIPFLVTLLFVVHPVHTEVVANIKGRDELMALLFSLLTWFLLIKWYDHTTIKHLVAAGTVFFLALLSKESAVPFILLIPLSFWYFREFDIRKALISAVPMVGLLAIYLILRQTYAPAGDVSKMPKEILNNPFLNATYAEQLATVAVTFVKYLGLLIAPISLTHDYYFNQVPVTNFGDPVALLGLAITLAMAGFAFWGLIKKNNIGFALIFYFATLFLVSNIVFPIGTTMGERFIFIPSIGFILAFVLLLKKLGEWIQTKSKGLSAATFTLGICALAAVIFAGRTFARNPVWENNETLFLTDAETSTNSAKLQTAAGGTLVERGTKELSPKKEQTLNQAIRYLDQAIKVYPDHGQAHLLRGNALFALNRFSEAADAFTKAIFHRPNLPNGLKNLAIAQFKAKDYPGSIKSWKALAEKSPETAEESHLEVGNNFIEIPQPDSAIFYYQKAMSANPADPTPYAKMGMVFGRYYQDFGQATQFLRTAISKGDTDPGTFENLGITFAMSGDLPKAIEIFQEGIQKYPNAANLYFNLGVTYGNLGDTQAAQQAMNMAHQLDPAKFK